MKFLLLLFVVLVCCDLTSAWWGGGRSSSKGSKSNSGKKSSGKTKVDVGVGADKSGAKVSGSVTHQDDGWSASAGGSANTNGDWEVGGKLSIELGKRSISWNGRHYTITIHALQCNFDLYDLNSDGVITKDEVIELFGKEKEADDFFNELDLTSGDGEVDRKEFKYMAHKIINGCGPAETPKPL